MKKIILLIAVMLVLVVVDITFAKDNSFVVIVNVDNPDSVITKDALSDIFLKKTKKWESMNETTLPIDLVEKSKIREAFSQEIHDRNIAAIKSYWQQKIFSGRGVPPPEKETDDDIISYVEQHKGAVGYISKSVSLTSDKVKIIKVKKE